MHVLSSWTISALPREINTKNNPLVSDQAVRHSSACIILYENNMLCVKYYDK